MKRRTVFASLAGTYLSGLFVNHSAKAHEGGTAHGKRLIPVSLNERFELSIESEEIDVTKELKASGELGNFEKYMSPISLKWGVLNLSRGNNLSASLGLDLRYVKNIDFWISAAIFDQYQRLLGATNYRESLELNSGFIERNGKTITLDFGKSAAFERAKFAAFSISDANV